MKKKTAQNKKINQEIRISVSNLLSFVMNPKKDTVKLSLNFRKYSLKASLVSKKFKLSIGIACIAVLLGVVSFKVITRPAQIEVAPSEPQKQSEPISQAVLGDSTKANEEVEQEAASDSGVLRQASESAVLGESIKLPEGLTASNTNPVPTQTPSSPPPGLTFSQTPNQPKSSLVEAIKEKVKNIVENIIPTRSIKLSKASLKFNESLFIALQNLKPGDLKISMTYANGEEVETKIKETAAGLELEKPSDFKPGKYTLKITDVFGNNYTQDFSWGVLALNVNKSVFTPSETAKISMAVLDERGEMVCDAKLVLSIKYKQSFPWTEVERQVSSEQLTTDNGKIKTNDICDKKEFSLTPDYEAEYQVKGIGVYELILSAETNNGKYTITDSFEVKESVLFDVERTSATRIYPPIHYPVYLDVVASEDFTGKVKEIVPDTFQIFQEASSSGNLVPAKSNIEVKAFSKLSSVTLNNKPVQELEWDISLKKGEKVRFGYKYKAPLKSPDFYTLGPLSFEDNNGQNIFSEARVWQIAVDVSSPSIEQQINFLDQEYSTTSTTYAPTDNSLGLIHFDPAKYNGTLSLKFEGEVKSVGTGDAGNSTQIFCISASDCKMVYVQASNGDLIFVDCDDANCTTGTTKLIDGNSGCVLSGCINTEISVTTGAISMYCLSTSDCKISYSDTTNSSLRFADCDDATCSTGTVNVVDGDTGCSPGISGCSTTISAGTSNSVYCLSSSDCKISYRDTTNSSLRFADCDDATCSTGTVNVVDGDTGCSPGISGCSTSSQTSFSNPRAMVCLSTSDCKIAYQRFDGAAQDLYFANCNNSTCSSGSVTLIEGSAGCVLNGCVSSTSNYGGHASMYCSATDDCKIAYTGNGDSQLKFADCANADCSCAPTACTSSNGAVKILDGSAGCILNGCSTTGSAGLYSSIFCPSSDDCKIASLNGTQSVLKFADCANADCSCAPTACSASNGAVKILDGSAGCTLTNCITSSIGSGGSSVYCLSATDCKVGYQVSTQGLFLGDCDSATCNSGTTNLADSGAGEATLGLFNSSGTQVTCASGSPSNVEVAGSGNYSRKRTGEGTNTCAFTTSQLTAGDYTVRLKVASGTGYIKAARLIIIQSHATALTDTEHQIEVGNNQTTTSTTETALTNPKYYRYDNSKFSGTKTAYFEATLKSGTITSSTQNTTAKGPTTQGTNSPAWTNPQNMEDNDGTNRATGDNGDIVNQETFGFTNSDVPANATIVGVTVAIDALKTGTRNNSAIINLLNVGTCTSQETAAWTTVEATYTLGGSANTWSCTDLTPANVTSASFGVSVQADSTGGAGPNAGTYLVDYVAVTIHYTAPVAQTVTAELYNRTDGQAVANSTVTLTDTTWTRVRGGSALSTNWDTSNADEYEVRIKTANASATASIANAKIIIDQTDASGFTATQLIHQYANTLATDGDSTYTNSDFINKFDPASFNADTSTYNFEATLKSSAGTGYAQLYNRGDSSAVASSEVTHNTSSYSRQRTASPITMPASAKDMDTQIKNSASNTTSVSNSWLIIDLTFSYGPTKVIITKSNGNTLTAGSCNNAGDYAFTVQLQNASNVATNPTQTTVVRLTNNSTGTYTFYSSAGASSCSSAISNGDVSFNTSTNTVTVYVSDTKKSPTNWVITADDISGDSLTSDTENYTVNAGAVTRLVVTLPGQTFTDGSGNSGSVTARTAGSSFNITKISATDDYFNINATSTNYDNDTRTLAYSGPAAAPDGTSASYTTSVQFTNGQSTTTLATILYKAENATITVTDGGSLGYSSSSVTVNPGEISADTADSIVTGNLSTTQPSNLVTITITLKDTWRNPKASVAAGNISIGATSASSITQPSSATNASGVTTGTVYWTNTGSKTVDVTISNVSLVQNDGSTADVDGKLDDTHIVTIELPPSVLGISSGVKLKSGTRIRTN